MDKLYELALRSQTIIGGIHFFVYLFSWPLIIGFLKDYLDKDESTFNCEPKPSNYARQRCYDHYVSTLSPLLTPLDFAGITYGALGFLWLVFILTGASIVRRIGRERNLLRKKRQSRRFMSIFVCHVCFQLAVLVVMMVLFFSFQTVEFPATYRCAQENTTLIAASQASSFQRIICSDLRYKEKTKLNIYIIVIMAISVAFCMLTLIHLGLTRKPLLEQLLGYIFIPDNNDAICLVGKYRPSQQKTKTTLLVLVMSLFSVSSCLTDHPRRKTNPEKAKTKLKKQIKKPKTTNQNNVCETFAAC